MPREKNPCGKSRPVDDPYEVWENPQGWTWNVRKKYQLERNEGPYARWFCAVKSPLTYGSWEYGDVYKSDVMEYAVRTDIDYDDKRPIEPFSGSDADYFTYYEENSYVA